MNLNKSFSDLNKGIVKTKDVVVKASETAIEISKTYMMISNKEKSLDELYEKLGKKFYKKYSRNPVDKNDFKEIVDKIDKEKKELNTLQEKLSRLKSKNNYNK